MGIQNFSVVLDNPAGVFYAGQVLSGTVKFVTTKPMESDGAFVKFLGMAEVHWTERHTHGKQEPFYCSCRRLFGVKYFVN